MTIKTAKTATITNQQNFNLEENTMNDKTKRNAIFNNKIWMNSEEASEYLRTTIGSLRNMVYRGKLPAKKLGNRLRFKRIDLDRLIDNSFSGKGV